MAKETLTLELDSSLVERVRRYSADHGTDVTETVCELIASLPQGEPRNGNSAHDSGKTGADDEEWLRSLPPITRSLIGIAAGDVGEEAYKEHLWRKYGR